LEKELKTRRHIYYYIMLGEIISNGTVELLQYFKYLYGKNKYFDRANFISICDRSDGNVEILDFALDNFNNDDNMHLYCLFHAIKRDHWKMTKYLIDRYQIAPTNLMKKLIVKFLSVQCLEGFTKSGMIEIDEDMVNFIISTHIKAPRVIPFIKMVIELGDSGYVDKIEKIMDFYGDI
jgi:hypothetical protein